MQETRQEDERGGWVIKQVQVNAVTCKHPVTQNGKQGHDRIEMDPIRGSHHQDLVWEKLLTTANLVNGRAKSGKRLHVGKLF